MTKDNESTCSRLRSSRFRSSSWCPNRFDGDDWFFEIKHDGFRILAIRDGASTRLYARDGRDITRGHRHLVEELESLKEKRFVLDGKLVVLDDDGRSNFSRLMNGRTGTHFYVFDLLLLGRKDFRACPLDGRKIALENLLRAKAKSGDSVRLCDHVIGHGKAFFETVKEAGLEGTVAEKKSAMEKRGVKSPDRAEAVMLAFADRRFGVSEPRRKANSSSTKARSSPVASAT